MILRPAIVEPRRDCRGCGSELPGAWLLCDDCWAALPLDLREYVAAARREEFDALARLQAGMPSRRGDELAGRYDEARRVTAQALRTAVEELERQRREERRERVG